MERMSGRFSNKLKNIFKILIFVLTVTLLGCQVELFSSLSEQEANEMIAILLKNGLDADKLPGKKGTAKIMVEKSDMAQAISLLKNHGFPKEKFSDLGSVFTKEGLISSPLEERARYIYAVSQELSETLTNLDGVLTARVHVVLPELDSTGDMTNPSSASVFIKYAEGFNIEGAIPQIKLLVNNSIEGLDYDKISVALFPTAKTATDEGEGLVNVLSMKMSPDSATTFYMLVGFIFILLAGLLGTGGYMLWKRKSNG